MLLDAADIRRKVIDKIKIRANKFGLLDELMRITLKEMLEGLKIGSKSDTLGVFKNMKKVNAIYPAFEIVALLIFRLDFYVATYQETELREPLFNFIADRMTERLCMEKNIFNNFLNKRMEEYGGIQADMQLTDESKQTKLLEGFLYNLVYSISEQAFYDWEGEIKPLIFLPAHHKLTIHIIYKEMLLPVEIIFVKTIRNLFIANSDFTKLSDKEINLILEKSSHK